MNSRTRAAIDVGQPYVCTMFPDDLMQYFTDFDGYAPVAGVSMKGFMPDWIGRFYATCLWMEKVSSAETIKHVPLEYLKSAYPGLHDLELDLAVAKVAG